MDLKKLGAVLRNQREALGIPAAVVARRAGIGRTTLWVVERGENPRTGKPDRLAKDKLERLATMLGIRGEQLNEVLALAGYAAAPERAGGAAFVSGPRRSRSRRPDSSSLGVAASPVSLDEFGENESIEEGDAFGQEIADIIAEFGLPRAERDLARRLVAAYRESARRLMAEEIKEFARKTCTTVNEYLAQR